MDEDKKNKEPATPEKSDTTGEKVTISSHPPPMVLVAEDNNVVRRGLTNFLNKWGYEPIEAETGDEAMAAIEANPDLRLAILDWNLPGLSGMQICQRVRTRPGNYIYIIMFSARKSAQEQIMALDGGADDYLTKPSKPSILRARLGVGRRIIETAINKS